MTTKISYDNHAGKFCFLAKYPEDTHWPRAPMLSPWEAKKLEVARWGAARNDNNWGDQNVDVSFGGVGAHTRELCQCQRCAQRYAWAEDTLARSGSRQRIQPKRRPKSAAQKKALEQLFEYLRLAEDAEAPQYSGNEAVPRRQGDTLARSGSRQIIQPKGRQKSTAQKKALEELFEYFRLAEDAEAPQYRGNETVPRRQGDDATQAATRVCKIIHSDLTSETRNATRRHTSTSQRRRSRSVSRSRRKRQVVIAARNGTAREKASQKLFEYLRLAED